MSCATVVTNSSLSCFRACPRKYHLRYEVGLRRDGLDGLPARVGTAFHAACEAADKGEDVEAAMSMMPGDDHDLALVAAMYSAHEEMYAGVDPEAVETELAFEIPLVGEFSLAGVIDRIVRLDDGRLAIMERKTTSRDFSPGSDYWLRLQMDTQISLYMWAARKVGYDVETVLYDVTRRPSLRPYRATPPEKRRYKKDGTLYASQRAEDESAEDFATRIAESIAKDPVKHFARVEIARLDSEIEACVSDMLRQLWVMRSTRESSAYFANPGSCLQPFRCDYLEVCRNTDLEINTPAGFYVVDQVHTELPAMRATPGGSHAARS